jgi:hypothetical protein
MAPLGQRMVEDMQLRGLSEKTQEAYVRCETAGGALFSVPSQIWRQNAAQPPTGDAGD